MSTSPTTTRYLPPGRGDRAMNALARRLTRAGVGLWGARELRVAGRRSGEIRTTVVNVLEVDGIGYLVAARGETEWVRNLRAAEGRGELRIGRRTQSFVATELTDDAKPAILRPYLERWAFEVGRFFDDVDASSTEEQLRAIAGNHPVFRLSR